MLLVSGVLFVASALNAMLIDRIHRFPQEEFIFNTTLDDNITVIPETSSIRSATTNETNVVLNYESKMDSFNHDDMSQQGKANDMLQLDISKIITLRDNDWRDAHEERMIIWSHESQFHPEYGRGGYGRRGESDRHSNSSKIMSFMILGSVIGFIIYTYVSHVILLRKLAAHRKQAQLRELIHKSALIMAGSVQQTDLEFSARRRSLINMFRGFKL